MELNERLCRSMLWLAWQDTKIDWDDCEDEMPEFPRPKMVEYMGCGKRLEHDFYRKLLYKVLNDVPFYIKE